MCVLIFSTIFVRNISHSEKKLASKVKKKYIYIGLHVKYALILSNFNETLIFSTDRRKNPQISNFVKIRLLRAELLHADRRTDTTKLIVAFLSFVNAPQKFYVLPKQCTYLFCTDLRTNSDHFLTQHSLIRFYNLVFTVRYGLTL